MARRTRPQLMVLVGIPGSGKTTFARKLAERCPALRLVSPDAIRQALYPGYDVGQVNHRHIDHHRVFREAYRAVAEGLERGEDVLFDATSLTLSRRRTLITLGRRAGASVTAHYFPIALSDAMRRNSLRPRHVPNGVIAHMAKILVPPEVSEGFDRVVVHPQSSSLMPDGAG